MKVLIVDRDAKYVHRLVTALQRKYENRYDLLYAPNVERAMAFVSRNHPDLILADRNTAESEEAKELFPHISAILVADANIEMILGKTAICKYRSVEEIHQEILGVLADTEQKVIFSSGNSDCRVMVFTSPAGGTGCSLLAASFAVKQANAGRRVLFFSLSPYDDPDLLFQGTGKYSMSDLIFAGKDRRQNFAIKIESYLKKSREGVFFFGGCRNALDMLELTESDTGFLLEQMKKSGLFDVIAIDIPFRLDQEFLQFLDECSNIFWVNDGRLGSAKKIERAYAAYRIQADQLKRTRMLTITGVINNKYQEEYYCRAAGVPEYGMIPDLGDGFLHLDALAKSDFFTKVG